MPAQPPPQGGLGQSWFVLDFQAGYDGFAPKITGGELHGTYGPAFVETQESWAFEGQAVLHRTAAEPDRVLVEAAGNLVLSRRRSFEISGQRHPAERLLAARRDDEELLLLL